MATASCNHSLADSPQPIGATGTVRAMAMLVGMGGLAVLAFWLPWLERNQGQFALIAMEDQRLVSTLPAWLVHAALAAVGIGGLGLLAALWKDTRLHTALGWCKRWIVAHPVWAVLVALVSLAAAVDVYELLYDPFNKKHGLRPWMLREDLQRWLVFGTVILGGLAVSAAAPRSDRFRRLAGWLNNSLHHRQARWWVLAAAVPVVLAAAMNAVALEGIPHFSDSLTYLIQGRIVHSGQLWVPAPKHHELFKDSLFFLEVDGRFFGKYPIGWPTIVGGFDRLGIGFAANAVLAGLATLLTGLVASEFTSRRVATLAALLFGLSPWIWFNGANFASHVASTCAVLAFVWLFLRTLRTQKPWAAIGAGLALGAGVLIRPFDAAMFALPAIVAVLVCQVRWPKQWIGLGTLIAAGALVGVGVYLWTNAQTTGHPLKSPYALESRWSSDWNPTGPSMLGRLAFQVSELNGRFPGWGVGGLTVAILGAVAAGTRWRTSGLKLLAASTVLFFLGSTAFGFTNVWWGPRWLLPVVPLLAILGAELLDRSIMRLLPPESGQKASDPGSAAAAQLAVCLLLTGLVVGLASRYCGQFYQHRLMPPHMVSSAAHQTVIDQGLEHAVVAMPPIGNRPPLDARAGLAYMAVPFEANPVIYVRSVPHWPDLAAQCYPGRDLYVIAPDPAEPKGFTLRQVKHKVRPNKPTQRL